MGRFNFQSPGAAASAGIREFIAEQAALRRQSMLDELNRQNMEKQWADADADNAREDRGEDRVAQQMMENLAIQQRQVRVSEANQQSNDLDALTKLTPGGAAAGDIKSEGLLNRFRDAGAMRSKPAATPSVGSSYGPVDQSLGDVVQDPTITGPEVPAEEYFAGDADYQKKQRDQALLQQLMQNPEFMADQGRAQTVQAAQAGINLSPTLAGPQGSQWVYDDATGQRKNLGPVNPRDQFDTRSRAPLGPAAAIPSATVVGTDPATNLPLIFMNRLDNEGKPVILLPDGTRYAGVIGPKPNGAGGSRVSASEANQIINTRRDLEGYRAERQGGVMSSWFGMKGSPSPNEVAAEIAYKAALGNVFAKDSSDPIVKEIAMFVASDSELSKLPTTAVMQHPKLRQTYELGSDWTQDDTTALDRLLNYSRGIVETQ